MRINNNIVALQSVGNLNFTGKKIESSMRKISSGLKINSVKDDAAGMAIVGQMKFQILGSEMAKQNTLDGISMVQTADGAMNEIQNIIQRIRELSVQSANETNATDDRMKMQDEADQLLAEVDNIVNQTEFNTIKLLNGQLSNFVQTSRLGIDAHKINKVIYSTDNIPSGEFSYDIKKAGSYAKTAGVISSLTTFSDSFFTINGEDVQISANDTADKVLEKIRSVAILSEIEVYTPDYPGNSTLVFVAKDMGEKNKIVLAPAGSPALINLGLSQGEYAGTNAEIENLVFIDELGNTSNNQSVTYSGNKITISGQNRQEMIMQLQTKVDSKGEFFFLDNTPINDDGTISTGTITSLKTKIEGYGDFTIQIGANKLMEIKISIPQIDVESLGLKNINLKTTYGSGEAITDLDLALNKVSQVRSKLGAYQNRLEYTNENLANQITNLEMAQSRILDTDIAMEMTKLTQENVINQAGIAILAQANQRPQQILQLLQ